MAGETLAQGIQAVRRAERRRGCSPRSITWARNVVAEMDAARATQDYLDLLNAIAESGVNSNVSLKLTQLGLDISFALCLNNMPRAFSSAPLEYGNFVQNRYGKLCLYSSRLLRLYRNLRDEHGLPANVGVVIQAYLFRS